MKSIAVLDGFGSKDSLLSADPDYVIEKVGDLIDLFEMEFAS
jgi:phosphoglycolate phosphatase-like HAD superfamily hydrolase